MARARAVAVIAKSPRPGQVKTRLCPPLSPSAAAALHGAFLRDTVDTVRALAEVEPVLVYSPAEDREMFLELAGGARLLAQGEGDLGDRMDAMFRVLCAEGFRSVVAVGADVPTLPRDRLRDALALLERPDVDVVVGPAEDGGYYLIGVREPEPRLFRDVAWSTDRVLAQTRDRAAEAGLRLATLPTWWDVDTPADLARLIDALRADHAAALHTRAVLVAHGLL